MIKKTVTYTDFNGFTRTEDFYFNLTEAELTEMQVSVDGGMKAFLQKIIDTHDEKQLIEHFKWLVLMAYGEKSADGRRFVKSEEIRNGFAPTEAYSKIFMELSHDANAASEFVNGVIPQNLSSQVKAEAPSQAN